MQGKEKRHRLGAERRGWWAGLLLPQFCQGDLVPSPQPESLHRKTKGMTAALKGLAMGGLNSKEHLREKLGHF